MIVLLSKLKELSSKLQALLKLESQPVAVKLVKESSEIKGFKTPGEMKVKLAVCQTLAMSWRYGWSVAVTNEECACQVAKVIFGWLKVDLETFASAFLKCGFFKDMCAAIKGVKSSLEECNICPDSCFAVASTPMSKAPWLPDVVLMYCNPAQSQLLALGYSYINGDSVEIKYSGKHASCGYAIAKTFSSKKPVLVPPGGGDKVFAACDPGHVIFALPPSLLEGVVEGIEHVRQAGVTNYPTPIFLRFEPQLPQPFRELEREVE